MADPFDFKLDHFLDSFTAAGQEAMPAAVNMPNTLTEGEMQKWIKQHYLSTGASMGNAAEELSHELLKYKRLSDELGA